MKIKSKTKFLVYISVSLSQDMRKGQFQKKKMTDLFILLRKYENDNTLAFKAAHRHQITPLFVKMHGLRNNIEKSLYKIGIEALFVHSFTT